MDNDIQTYLTGHCDFLTTGKCHRAACKRFGVKQPLLGNGSEPWCIALKIVFTLKAYEELTEGLTNNDRINT